MILRIFIIFLLIIFYKPIFKFLKKNNVDNLTNIKKKLTNNSGKIIEDLLNTNLFEELKKIKKFDKKMYINIIKKLKNIKKTQKNILKTDFNEETLNKIDDIKLQKEQILNILSSLIVSKGFINFHSKLLELTKNHISNILNEIKENKNLIDIDNYDIKPSDLNTPDFSFNYNIF